MSSLRYMGMMVAMTANGTRYDYKARTIIQKQLPS